MNSLVSIIMPAYNAEKYITESIQSVVDQSYKHWELIIVDDGSTDNTAEVTQPYVEQDERIIYVFQPNSGQGKARNRGLVEAKGELIAFLDADDLWQKNKLEIQVKYMNANPKMDLLFSSAQSFQGAVQNIIKPLNHNNRKLYCGLDAVREFIKGNKVPILTVLVKKSVLAAVGNFDEARHLQNVEDSHLWLKLLFQNYKLKSSSDILAYYRVHEQQSTSNTFYNTLKEINLIKDFLGRDLSIDTAIVAEIKKKYFSVFIKKRSTEEKQILLVHYAKNFAISDKLVLSFFLKHLPLRGFSLYYRYIHSNILAKSKMV